MNKKVEHHPDWYHCIPGMRTLILGTYPPSIKKRHFEFYYPNKINRFWKVMARVASTQLNEFNDGNAVIERKLLMEKLQVGVQNLGKKIEREDESASDNKIKILEFQDISSIIENSSCLRSILLTGHTGKTSTYTDFMRYLDENHIQHSFPDEIKSGRSFTVTVKGKNIKVLLGNSTSTAARRVSEDMLVDQFKEAIFG
jgi:G:T/U-mismatch repair DNA glycosylase